MAVFLVRAPSGSEYTIEADTLDEARQLAVQRLQIPYATFASQGGDVTQMSSGRNADFDRRILQRLENEGATQLQQQPRPTATRRLRGNTVQVDPITGQRIFMRRDDPNVVASQDRPTRPAIGAGQTTETDTGERSTLDFPFTGRAPGVRITGLGGEGGVTFAPTDPLSKGPRTVPVLDETDAVNEMPGGGSTRVDDAGNIITENQDGSVSITVSNGETYYFDASGKPSPSNTAGGAVVPYGQTGATGSGGVPVVPADTPRSAMEVLQSGDFADFANVPLLEREQVLPESAFRGFLEAAGIRPGAVGSFLPQTQYGNAVQTYAGLNALGLIPENQTFTEFLASAPLGNFQQAGRQAINALAAGQGQLPSDFQVFGDQGSFTADAQALANLAALGSQRRGIGGGLFSRSAAEMQRQLQDQAFQGQNPDFVSYLQSVMRPVFANSSPLVGIGTRR